jgi:hypothetical protein
MRGGTGGGSSEFLVAPADGAVVSTGSLDLILATAERLGCQGAFYSPVPGAASTYQCVDWNALRLRLGVSAERPTAELREIYDAFGRGLQQFLNSRRPPPPTTSTPGSPKPTVVPVAPRSQPASTTATNQQQSQTGQHRNYNGWHVLALILGLGTAADFLVAPHEVTIDRTYIDSVVDCGNGLNILFGNGDSLCDEHKDRVLARLVIGAGLTYGAYYKGEKDDRAKARQNGPR